MADSSPKGLKERIQAKLTGPTLCAMATINEDGKPWVRYMMLAADERLTLWGATFAGFRKVGQLRKNPEVHLTTGAKDMETAESYLQNPGEGRGADGHRIEKGALVRLPEENLFRPR